MAGTRTGRDPEPARSKSENRGFFHRRYPEYFIYGLFSYYGAPFHFVGGGVSYSGPLSTSCRRARAHARTASQQQHLLQGRPAGHCAWGHHVRRPGQLPRHALSLSCFLVTNSFPVEAVPLDVATDCWRKDKDRMSFAAGVTLDVVCTYLGLPIQVL